MFGTQHTPWHGRFPHPEASLRLSCSCSAAVLGKKFQNGLQPRHLTAAQSSEQLDGCLLSAICASTTPAFGSSRAPRARYYRARGALPGTSHQLRPLPSQVHAFLQLDWQSAEGERTSGGITKTREKAQLFTHHFNTANNYNRLKLYTWQTGKRV